MSALLTDRYDTMPWEQIDNVVFDVGNVLIVFDPVYMLRVLFPDETLLQSKLMDVIFRSPYWVMLDRGVITPAQAAEQMAKRAPELLPEILHTLNNWSNLIRPIPEGVRAMECAKAHGKKIFLLSNYNDVFFAQAQALCPFLNPPMVDGMIISAHVHINKPDPAIYRTLCEKYSLIPDRTVFVDDSAGNVEGALHAAWQGIWKDAEGRLAEFMGFSLPQEV
ncbi:MAG: HAD family phosphatase [Clostridia bacterium]|nr:HAD family phosphatase [Clostridia bacterium]